MHVCVATQSKQLVCLRQIIISTVPKCGWYVSPVPWAALLRHMGLVRISLDACVRRPCMLCCQSREPESSSLTWSPVMSTGASGMLVSICSTRRHGLEHTYVHHTHPLLPKFVLLVSAPVVLAFEGLLLSQSSTLTCVCAFNVVLVSAVRYIECGSIHWRWRTLVVHLLVGDCQFGRL